MTVTRTMTRISPVQWALSPGLTTAFCDDAGFPGNEKLANKCCIPHCKYQCSGRNEGNRGKDKGCLVPKQSHPEKYGVKSESFPRPISLPVQRNPQSLFVLPNFRNKPIVKREFDCNKMSTYWLASCSPFFSHSEKPAGLFSLRVSVVTMQKWGDFCGLRPDPQKRVRKLWGIPFSAPRSVWADNPPAQNRCEST